MLERRVSLDESSTFLDVPSRQPCTSHQPSLLCRVVSRARVVNLAILSKSHNFLALNSFCILDIILPTDIQIGWFKLLWKDNSEYYNFYEETFLRKSLLDGRKYPWTYYICLNGDPWDCMVPFRVLEYKLGIFQNFQRDNYCLSSGKIRKDIRRKKSEEQEEIIPYIYKCWNNFQGFYLFTFLFFSILYCFF